MSKIRGIIIAETEKARQVKVSDRILWIPKSVTESALKFAPDSNGHREAVLDIQDWFCEKESL